MINNLFSQNRFNQAHSPQSTGGNGGGASHSPHSTYTVSQQRIQPILRITQNFIVAMLLRYSYVQEYVTVEIFYLALWYFQYSVTGEQSTNSMRSVFAKPNHQWKVCSLLSYSYALKHMFPMHVVQISAHIVVHIYW